MRYHENAPTDDSDYARDLGLYFQDLKGTRQDLSQLINAFAGNDFDPAVTGDLKAMGPQLSERAQAVAVRLHNEWQAFLSGLDARIGDDPTMPQLETAAHWIDANHSPLEATGEDLFNTLRADVARRATQASTVNRLLLGAALIVALATGLWFYRRVLIPLNLAVMGFRQVANGDFSHRVPIVNDDEIGWLTSTFNGLSGRLDALRKLLTGLERGANLEETVHILSTTLPGLIPVDWIGVLLIGPDGDFRLAKAYSDGKPDNIGNLQFVPDHTLLEECLNSQQHLHIPDVTGVAHLSKHYVFLKRLSDLGRRDAVFLPIGTGKISGVAVFASRYPNNFRPEHLELVNNLGGLLGVSLGRSIQLSESSRLASIGEFASGVVHEIRNPLATIALAFEHLDTVDGLAQGTRKRIRLAGQELTRLERLLSDILLYAKPLKLSLQTGDLPALVREVAVSVGDGKVSPMLDCDGCRPVAMDHDRMRQVIINLINNAVQASPADGSVGVACKDRDDGYVEMTVTNRGEPIEPRVLERIFDPFVTTKRQGTGLGLPIVQRIIDAHGGRIEIRSDAATGTRAVVRIPVATALYPAAQAAVDASTD